MILYLIMNYSPSCKKTQLNPWGTSHKRSLKAEHLSIIWLSDIFPLLNLKDGHFRLYEWPNMHIIVDEPGVHKSFQDMDFR